MLNAKEITVLLKEAATGNRAVVDHLFPLVFDELRLVAVNKLKLERSGHTLQPTALVNETYLKMVTQNSFQFQNRAHFFAISAMMMRRILTEHGRNRKRIKRGNGSVAVALDIDIPDQEVDLDSLIDFNDALKRLEELDERQARVVELRYFGGLTLPEIADLLEVSTRTVEYDWQMARAWIKREMDS